MVASFTAKALFEAHRDTLSLVWQAGAAGAAREISLDPGPLREARYVGYLNLIRPNLVQVLGRQEVGYLRSLDAQTYAASLQRCVGCGPSILIVADDQGFPEALRQAADEMAIPLFASPLPSDRLVSRLYAYVTDVLAKRITLHGVFMEVMGLGVLLTGAAGVGKSELGLELIHRGHRLVADDAPEFSCVTPDVLQGTCPEVLRDFLEVRGLGLLNIRAMFGDYALAHEKRLELVIRLELMNEAQLSKMERLHVNRDVLGLLGVAIPRITLPVAPGRNLAILVETAARNHALGVRGYDPVGDFQARQRRLMAMDGL